MAYEVIILLFSKGVVKIIRIWCPEEGEQEIENAQAFSLRTPEASAEGRNSPLVAYGAITGIFIKEVVRKKELVPRRGLEPPRPYGH